MLSLEIILLRILWFNWRDIKHPDAGGAEIFTHEIMHRLVKKGHDMTLFTALFPNGLKNETIDGVKIIRDGGKYTVYNKARNYYNKCNEIYDFVIDESNTRPFLTPKFAKEKPILAIYHQLSREGWFYETPFPLNYLGYYYLEWKWLSYYKDIPTVTVSNSTKDDLEKFGIKKIFMVPEGITVTPLSGIQQKESSPTVVFIGRLRRHKLPHHAIEAFSIIKKEIPDAKMWVVGRGYMRKELEEFDLKDVIFYGHVKNDLKDELLSKAHLILVPAVREGWGLVVTESNAMGTPAVAYNVPGLRDSVKHGETGILVKENSPNALAHSAIALLKDRELLDRLSYNALAFSKQFSWDNTANEFDKIIKKIYLNHARTQ
ncbi:MAG: glycosyltransferase family 4 protein [Thermoproteota archaeon]|nr:glycosyltransferase family 4 protein [Thermoproteota archaeon]